MKLLSLLGWIAVLGVLTVGCGEDPPSDPGFTPVEPDVETFSEDLVIAPVKLGDPISDTTIKTSAFSERSVATAKESIFEINTQGKWAMKVEEIGFDFSSCGLTAAQEASAAREIIVSLVKQDGSKIKDIALASLEGDGAVFVDVSSLEEDDRVKMNMDLAPSSCSNLGANITYKLSNEEKLSDEELENKDDVKLSQKLTAIEDLTFGSNEVANGQSETETSQKTSVLVFGFESTTDSFFKMLLLKADLGDCSVKPAEEAAAGDELRFNLISTPSSRNLIAADILDESSQYASIDYSVAPKAYVEIDNIPASCASVNVRVSHWLGSEDKSPEVVRSCSLKSNPTSDVVTWSPDLRAFVIADSTGSAKADARSLCSSTGVLDEAQLGDNIEIKDADEDGDLSRNTYNLKLNDEVISEISCTASGNLNFIHDHIKLSCLDRLRDVDDVAGVTSVPDEEDDESEDQPEEGEGEE